MRFAFLHHIFQQGSGIEQVILELTRQLNKIGHQADIITYFNEYKEVATIEYKLPIESRLVRSVLAPLCFKTSHLIRQELDKYDVVVTSLYPMSVVPLFPEKVKAKVVFIEWGIQPYSAFSSFADKLYLWILNRADRYAIKYSDKVFVANEVTRRWVEAQGIKPTKMQLYGLNFERLDNTIDYSHLYKRHNLNKPDGILMYAGRQSPHKNIELLILTVAQLRQRYNVKLFIVGKESFEEYANSLRNLVTELKLQNDVIFTGLVSERDLAGYYNMCDIFVNASLWEGFLNPEPYAFKKPIVALNIAPHDETVWDDMTGLLVKNKNSIEFAENISELLDNKNKMRSMGEAGYKWAKASLDYSVVTDEFIKTIKEIL